MFVSSANIDINPIEFKAPRLHLRQWRNDDKEPFARLNADPVVMAFFPAPLDRKSSDDMATRYETLITERGCGFWAVENKPNNTFICVVGLHIPTHELPFALCVTIG